MYSRPQWCFPICAVFKGVERRRSAPPAFSMVARRERSQPLCGSAPRSATGDARPPSSSPPWPAEAGKEVSGMLEAAARAPELKENSSKIIHAIACHRSPSSSSYRSELEASSNSLLWTEKSETNKRHIFNDYGGMKSGSFSQTLGRLYAWEKKLYEEVKAIDQIRQENKCVQLRNQDAKGSELRCAEKTRTNVRDLYTRIWVSLRVAESRSDRIQKLREEELQLHLVELLHGFARTRKVMVDSHKAQRQIMFEVNSFICPAYGKFCNDAQWHATLKLEVQLRSWRSCFVSYVSAQKAYIEALDGWLSKFILMDTIRYSRGISSIAPDRAGAPPLVAICHEWHTTLSTTRSSPLTPALHVLRSSPDVPPQSRGTTRP